MKKIEELLIREGIAGGAVYVFPSEAAVVSWRIKALKLLQTDAVRNDVFLSWDSFKESVTLHDRIERPVNSIHRKLFCADLLARNISQAPVYRYILPSGFDEVASGFADQLVRVLPGLKRFADAFNANEALFREAAGDGLSDDYMRLYEEYSSVLEKNSLFEPGWEMPDISTPDKKYYIVFPELIEDFEEYRSVLAASGCSFVSDSGAADCRYRFYDNSAIEGDEVLAGISGLLQQGLRYQDIAVTCPDEALAAYMVSKAGRYGIPLSVRSGTPVGELPGGRLPELIRSCYSGSFDIASMKVLLLFRAFLWKEKETADALIRFGIENRCLRNFGPGSNGDVWEQRLSNMKRWELKDFYLKLKKRITAVVKAGSLKKLSDEMQIFISTFLETDEELWDPETLKVFQRTREVLSSLQDAENALEGISIRDPLGLWIEVLKEKIYVSQADAEAIPLYRYRVSAGIRPKYHFIAGLNHENSAVVSVPLPFLGDQIRRGLKLQENNMTEAFLRIYSKSGDSPVISGAAETFSGVALAPAYFISAGSVDRIAFSEDSGAQGEAGTVFSDPEQLETSWWYGDFGVDWPLMKSQADGFDYSAATGLLPASDDFTFTPLQDSDLAGACIARRYGEDLNLKISATTLNRWTNCPYSYLLADLLGVRADEYVLQVEDPFTDGELLHEILGHFFTLLKESGQAFSVEKRDEYRELIRTSARTVFEDWEKRANYFFGPAWDTACRRALEYMSRMPEAEGALYDGYTPALIEDWLEYEIPGENIKAAGRTDRISVKAGRAAVIDYKRNWKKKKTADYFSLDESGALMKPPIGYQIPFYIILARQAGFEVDSTSYYSVTSAEHFQVSGEAGILDAEQAEALCRLTMNEIIRMGKSVREGIFTAPERCSGCDFYPVCRRKYAVRFGGRK